MGTRIFRNRPVSCFLACLIIGFFPIIAAACRSGASYEPLHYPELPEAEVLLQSPVITAVPYQETVYTGYPQPITASCEPAVPLVITYYHSVGDYWNIQNAFYDAPAEPGFYYVSINCAPGYGYAHTDDFLVEYVINKASVEIIADEIQSASYNGNPRRVQAESEPAVSLSYSYYPNPELRQTAVEAFSRPGGEAGSALSSALQNFTRVERAPAEQGIYYVLVFFSGNERYEPVYKEIEFTIGPPVRRN